MFTNNKKWLRIHVFFPFCTHRHLKPLELLIINSIFLFALTSELGAFFKALPPAPINKKKKKENYREQVFKKKNQRKQFLRRFSAVFLKLLAVLLIFF